MGDVGFEHSALTLSKTPISENVRTESGTHDAPKSPNDPDLARLIEAWPGLPGCIKAAIIALIEKHSAEDTTNGEA